MVLNELFTSFKYEKNKRFSVLQIWNRENENEYLKIILTDYLNYWIGKCKNFLVFQIVFHLDLKIFKIH